MIGGNNYIDLIWQIILINNFNLANNTMALIGKSDVYYITSVWVAGQNNQSQNNQGQNSQCQNIQYAKIAKTKIANAI